MTETLNEVFEQLRAQVVTDMAEETVGIDIHNILAKVLTEKFHGKKVTKRLQTIVAPLIREYLGDRNCEVYWSDSYGLYQIEVRPTGVNYGDRRGFYVANERDVACYDASKFGIDHDQCHGAAAIQRNMQRRVLLFDGTLNKLAECIVSERQARAHREALTEYESVGAEVRFFAEKLAKADA